MFDGYGAAGVRRRDYFVSGLALLLELPRVSENDTVRP